MVDHALSDDEDVSPQAAAQYCQAMSSEMAEIMRRAGAEALPLALALDHLHAVAGLYLRCPRRQPAPEKPAPDDAA
jgi:hypothetical protein